MAKAFESWTVLQHGPIQKYSENLWLVLGTMPNPRVSRVMTLARLKDGRIVVHNAIALEETAMKEIEAWGTPSVLVVPNGYHRQDAKIYKQRYPSLRVICPAGATKQVAQVVAPEGTYDDAPQDDTVRFEHLDGIKAAEGIVKVTSPEGVTVVFNDAICNVPKTSGMMGLMLSPTGQASVPRVMRWMVVKDKKALRGNLERIANTPNLRRVVVSHGAMLEDDPAGNLRNAGQVLTG